VEEVEDEPLFCERVAGTGIGKAMIMVTIRVPGDTGSRRRQQETREFRTVRKDLLALADWLRVWQVEKAGMEAASDYWKPVYFLLEREGFDCDLYPASRVKALPGRPKTDKLDSIWLAKITGRGSLAGSFVPPEDIRVLRTHTRYRRHLVQERTAEKSRCEKLPEDACLKLSSVITDVHGVSGREMLTAIIAGQRDPQGPGPDGPDPDARQDPPAGGGPGLHVLHRRSRLHPQDDAGQHRPHHRPDPGAG
jgi:transposase